MTAARATVISAVIAAVILGGLWIANDERFGRPEEFPIRERSTEAEFTIRGRPMEEDFTIPPPPRFDTLSASFKLCDGPIRKNCVVDGDTFWFKGDKIRVADIDAPEISSPRCEDERIVGEIARDKLLELLNAGDFSLQSGWRDTDRYGRKLRTVTRGRESLGEKLVEEGLARRWDEPRRDWCARD